MSFDVFGWLRRRAAEAVTAGIGDALAATVPAGEDAPDLDSLRLRLASAVPAAALPAAEEATQKPKTRKAG